jgi:hypothetical protein
VSLPLFCSSSSSSTELFSSRSLPSNDKPSYYSDDDDLSDSEPLPTVTNRGYKLHPLGRTVRRGKLGGWVRESSGFEDPTFSSLSRKRLRIELAPDLTLVPESDLSSPPPPALAKLPPPPRNPVDLVTSPLVRSTLSKSNPRLPTLALSIVGLIEADVPFIRSLVRVCNVLRGDAVPFSEYLGDGATLVASTTSADQTRFETSNNTSIDEMDVDAMQQDSSNAMRTVTVTSVVREAAGHGPTTTIAEPNGVNDEEQKPDISNHVVEATATENVTVEGGSHGRPSRTGSPTATATAMEVDHEETAPAEVVQTTTTTVQEVLEESIISGQPAQLETTGGTTSTAGTPLTNGSLQPEPTSTTLNGMVETTATTIEAEASTNVSEAGGETAAVATEVGGADNEGIVDTAATADDQQTQQSRSASADDEQPGGRRRSGRVATRGNGHSLRERSNSASSSAETAEVSARTAEEEGGTVVVADGGAKGEEEEDGEEDGEEGDEEEDGEDGGLGGGGRGLHPAVQRLVDPEPWVRSLFVSDTDVSFSATSSSDALPPPPAGSGATSSATGSTPVVLTPEEQLASVRSCLADLQRFLEDNIEYRDRLSEVREGILGIERRRKAFRHLIHVCELAFLYPDVLLMCTDFLSCVI